MGSLAIENSVVGGQARNPVTIGRRTVFGHRCLVTGANVGDLCEIGNASVLMSRAQLGDRVLLCEGTMVQAGIVAGGPASPHHSACLQRRP